MMESCLKLEKCEVGTREKGNNKIPCVYSEPNYRYCLNPHSDHYVDFSFLAHIILLEF